MLGWFRKQPDPNALLNQIEERLVKLIPSVVQGLKVPEPVYCLRIWYHGTDTVGDRTFDLTLAPEAMRQKYLVEKGDEAPHYLWCADEWSTSALEYGKFRTALKNADLAALFRAWFQHAEALEGPEASQLTPLRQLAQRVANQLNRIDWSTRIPATEDFIVFPADGSHTFCDDYGEMIASVPPHKIEWLKSQGMLGTKVWWTLGDPPPQD